MKKTMKLSEYAKVARVGDRVQAGKTLFCDKMLRNHEAEVTDVRWTSETDFFVEFDRCRHDQGSAEFPVELLAPADPWDALKAGDVLEDTKGDGMIRDVLAIVGECVFYSSCSARNDWGGFANKKFLRSLGWTIVGSSPSSPREVTMAEVVAKFGEDVVIKKE